MRMRLLVALAAGLLLGSHPRPDFGEVAQPQVIPPGSRWVSTDCAGQTWVDEFGRDGVWQSVCESEGILDTEKYTLNPTASPAHIDLSYARGIRRGIYRLEGDRLLICTGKRNSPNRPVTFAHRPAAGQHLRILKRLK